MTHVDAEGKHQQPVQCGHTGCSLRVEATDQECDSGGHTYCEKWITIIMSKGAISIFDSKTLQYLHTYNNKAAAITLAAVKSQYVSYCVNGKQKTTELTHNNIRRRVIVRQAAELVLVTSTSIEVMSGGEWVQVEVTG